MMWTSKLLLFALLGGTVLADHHQRQGQEQGQGNAWKSGSEYRYQVRGRTLAALHQVADQYTGMLMKAQLTVQPKSGDTLRAQVSKAQYAQIHTKLSDGWDSEIPENKLSYKNLPLSEKPFEMKMKNGAVDDLIVDQNLPNWEVNMLKSIASQLQVDVQGENLMKSKYNQEPEDNQAYGVFKTMEDSVTGKCEVHYDIAPLPDHVIQNKPELAPLPQLRGDGQMIDVVKSKNFSRCHQNPVSQRGFDGMNDWEAGSSNNGRFLARSSTSRIILSGSLARHTIQSSVTTNKVILSPELHEEQNGMVVSRLNLTLAEVTSASNSISSPSNPKSTGNLVYRYQAESNEDDEDDSSSSSSSSSDSSSDSSSSSSDSSSDSSSSSSDSSSSSSSSDSSSSSSSSESDSDSSSSSGSSSSSSEEAGQQNKRRNPRSPGQNKGQNKGQSKGNEDLSQAPRGEIWSILNRQGKNSEEDISPAKVAKHVEEIAKEIGKEIQRPSQIPQAQTLEKFDIIVELTRMMSSHQIERVEQSLYQPADKTNPNSESDSARRSAWAAFRDAIAAAGTGPALLAIKDLINQKKIQGAEAAEILASLPQASRKPTPQYMHALFTIATSSQVTEQSYLNSTAILAFTELARMVQQNNDTAHNRWQVDGIARPSSKDQTVATRQALPYLARKLKAAIRDADSPKILVNIRALGNLGHPQMLEVLEPYLEGTEDVSDFQRLAMVAAMDKLTEMHPKLARSVLFKIYQNTGEACEVRCAAVFQLMRTNPPASMLQRMAQFTNWDLNKQVNSAVKSAIESAAELGNNKQAELAENARAARDMLSPETHGLQYSKSYLKDYAIEEMNLAYKLGALTIGSEDSILPQGIQARLRTNHGGYKSVPLEVEAMVSSIDDLTNFLAGQMKSDDNNKNQKQKGNGGSSKWTPERIAKILNIQSEDASQLEGQISLDTETASRFMAFDNHTLDQIPQAIKKAAQALKQGQSFNATKFTDNAMYLSFPTEMGFPFLYSLKRPTLFKIGGEAKARSNPDLASGSSDEWEVPSTVNVTTDVHVVYSTKKMAKIGFITPFDFQWYVAGVNKNLQVNLPIRVSADIDGENQRVRVKLQPIQEDQDYNLMHWSTKPFTTRSDIREQSPLALNRNTQPIRSREPTKREYNIGEKSTGMAFRMKSSSDEEPQKTMWSSAAEQVDLHDAISVLAFPLAQKDIKGKSFDLSFDSGRSSAKTVVITASWDSQRSKENKNSGASSDTPQPSSQKPDSQQRQDELQDQAAAGIDDADVTSIDFGVEFQGQTNAQYVATAAMASSNTDDTSRVVAYYQKKSAEGKNYEVCLRAESETPNGAELNFAQAMKAESSSKVDVAVRFGEQCQSGALVKVQGKLEQSADLRQHLREHPMAQQCAKQMGEGDSALPACRNMTARANQMDEAHFTIKYENVPASAKNMTAAAYRIAHFMAYPNVNENTVDPQAQEENRIDIDIELSEDMERANVSINAPEMDAEFEDLEIAEWVRPLIAVDTVQSAAERLGNHATDGQHNPTCVLDNKSANTFDNGTYSVELGNCWHVVMAAVAQDDPDSDNEDLDIPEDMRVSVVARDVSQNEKEIKITLGDDEITFASSQSNPQVQVNGKSVKISMDESHTEMDDDEEQAVFEIFQLPDGSVKLSSNEFGVDAVFDGSRVKISAAQKYRGAVRGLCGTFNGEPADDFTTPENCIVKKEEEFAATYAITGEQCEGPAKQNAKKAEKAYCAARMNAPGNNVISNQEAGRPRPGQKQQGGRRGNNQQGGRPDNKKQGGHQGNCQTHQTKVVEENGRTCFSLRPVPACSSRCRPVQKKEKSVQMHCVPNGEAASNVVKQIRSGRNPDLRKKSVSKTMKMDLPTSCAA